MLDGNRFQHGITAFLLKELEKRQIAENHFAYDAGLTKSRDGKLMRQAKELRKGKVARKWCINDLCKIAAYFDIAPSRFIEHVEMFLVKTPDEQIFAILSEKKK